MTTTRTNGAHTFTEDDARLIDLYTDPEVPLREVRAELGISYAELERRLAQPHVRDTIERLARLHEQRASVLTRCAADDAATTLTQLILDRDAKPETRRKAATAILRAASAQQPKLSKRRTPPPTPPATDPTPVALKHPRAFPLHNPYPTPAPTIQARTNTPQPTARSP